MGSQLTKSLGGAVTGCWAALSCTTAGLATADEQPATPKHYEFCGAALSANAFSRPLDYADPANREDIAGVEFNHLSRDVELLVRGRSSESAIDDLGYILRQIPNHYRALAAMANFQLKNGYIEFYELSNIYTADCYFRRALNFRPDDPVLHVIYGVYLHKADELDAALTEYLIAEEIGPPNAELHYNLGLLYVDLKQYESARGHAKKAYALGYPLTGLRARLARLGEWTEN